MSASTMVKMRGVSILLMLSVAIISASVDIWVSKDETRALIGHATEIFYVQEGVVNEYAMRYTVNVPAAVSDLHFNWRRTSRKPVHYEVSIEVADPALVLRPSLNIPLHGAVPKDHEVFTVHLPCRPGVTGETEVELNMSLVLPRQASVRRKKTTKHLTLRRKRVCRAKVTQTQSEVGAQPAAPRSGDAEKQADAPAQAPPSAAERPPGDEVEATEAERAEQEGKDDSSGVLYIAIGCACGVVLVIMIILAVVLSRNNAAKRRKRALSDLSEEYDAANHYMQVPIPSFSSTSIGSSHHYATLRPLPTFPSYSSQKTVTTPLDPTFAPPDSKHAPPPGAYGLNDHSLSHSFSHGLTNFSQSSASSSAGSSGAGQRSVGGSSAGTRVRDVGARVSELMVDRRRVQVETVLQEGNFGIVASGWMVDPERAEKERLIIKTVSPDAASPSQVSLFLQEGLVFYGLRHKNLLSVIGVAVEDRTPPLVLYPHVKHWNLKRYLQTCSFGSRSDVRTLTARDLVDLAEQLTQALLYLHVQNICHTDVAARNCCIDDSLHVRLSDSALSRDLFPDDYACLADNVNRPIGWMSPEAIVTNQHTPASDVWSLGVLFWELTTLGQQPYIEVDPFEMAGFLEQGYRLAKPLNCPDSLFSVMAHCWRQEPAERPATEHLLDYLHELSKQLSHYV